jgi:hypothetical protein
MNEISAEAIVLLNESQPIVLLNDHNERIADYVRFLAMGYHLSNHNLLSLS